MNEIKLRKKELRKHFLALRDAIPLEEAARAAEALVPRLLEAVPVDAACIGAYVPMRSEVNIVPALRALHERGQALALPCVEGKRLRFRAYAPGDQLTPGAHGTQHPCFTAAEVTPDFLLIPLLAFDDQYHRLGYGAGYYDRTLISLREKSALKAALGIAYPCQHAEALPAEPHDMQLDGVVVAEI